MKRYRAIVGLFLLLAAGHAAAMDVCGMGQSEMNAVRDDGTRVSLVIEGAKLKDTPLWDLSNGEPPLSITRASEIAMKWAKEHFDDEGRIEVNMISLKSLRCGGRARHWYYVFDFSPVKNDQWSHEIGHWLAVLMDGSTVAPDVRRHTGDTVGHN